MDCDINFTEFGTPLPWIETLKNIYRISNISDVDERTRILKEYLNSARKYTNQNDYFKSSIKAIRERFNDRRRNTDKTSGSSRSTTSSSGSNSNDLKNRITKLESTVEELKNLVRNTIDARILPPTLSKIVDVQCGQNTLINKASLYWEIRNCFSSNAEFLLNFKELSQYIQGPSPSKTTNILKVGGAIIPLFKLVDKYIAKQLKTAPISSILKEYADAQYIVDNTPSKPSIDPSKITANTVLEDMDQHPHNIITVQDNNQLLFSLQKLWSRFYDAKSEACGVDDSRFLDSTLVWKIVISILIHEIYHVRVYLTETREDGNEYGSDSSDEFMLYSQKFIQS